VIRRALLSVEDVVRREVDERHAEIGDVLRAADVRRGGSLRIVLGSVDVRPGCRVQNEIDVAERRGRRMLDVPLGACQSTRAGKRLGESAAELAAGAGYDDASRAERIGDVVLQT
jgi:hypothetical protein